MYEPGGSHTADRAARQRKINVLREQLRELRERNLTLWNTYGSELCAGDMERRERALEAEITALEANSAM